MEKTSQTTNIKFDRIYIELSNICNFSCDFCSGADRQKMSLSLSQLTSAISQAAQFTTQVCLHVLGEPLVYPHFEACILLCAQNNLNINLVTNGFFISQNLNIILSYKRTFKKVCFSLSAYANRTDGDIVIPQILTAAQTLAQNGISIELRNIFPNNSFKQYLQQHITNHFGASADITKQRKIFERLYYLEKPAFIWPDRSLQSSPTPSKKGLYCLGAKSHIAILSNCAVVPCCLDSNGKIILGNLNNQTLTQILSAPPFKQLIKAFQNGTPAHPQCQTCKYTQK